MKHLYSLVIASFVALTIGCAPAATNAPAASAHVAQPGELEPGIWKEIDAPFDVVYAKLPKALENEGFGVVSELNPQLTFEKRLGKPFRKYRVLGACDPALAYEVLNADPKLGVLLPCSVAIYEISEGRTAVGAIEPRRSIGGAGGEHGKGLANGVRERLVRVLEAVAK
jgi:uncharacterized protein (DUF302 family)